MSVFYFAIGACIGSFLYCCIERIEQGITIGKARSFCFYCQKNLTLPDLIPIVSYLFTLGKCRMCKRSLPLSYPIFEFICGILTLLTHLQLLTLREYFIALILISLSLFDISSKSFPFICWLLPFSFLFISSENKRLALFFILLSVTSTLFSIGIGSGDFLAFALLALEITPFSLIWIIQISAFLGIFYMLARKKKGAIPFIPCLTLGYFITLILEGINLIKSF
ncbi:MAG: prepilin peptidase [Streptococcaceae bacterium]|jgi:leader peptidase (prepilin peptidase)/N-methyltransferase|nr:prepilin peptidase [Streptococcaceae bacterium]